MYDDGGGADFVRIAVRDLLNTCDMEPLTAKQYNKMTSQGTANGVPYLGAAAVAALAAYVM